MFLYNQNNYTSPFRNTGGVRSVDDNRIVFEVLEKVNIHTNMVSGISIHYPKVQGDVHIVKETLITD